jgi:hypothetical protein
VLEVDDALLVDRLEELKHEKLQLLGTLKEKLSCDTEEDVRKKLASNKQFAQVLEDFGVEVPMKESKTTGKLTYALAKNDTGFIALTEHEDPFIQQLAAVRLGTKSTIEESRIERFIDVGSRNKGRLPIPLKYYGAHTGRWAGSDKVNFQNLPSLPKVTWLSTATRLKLRHVYSLGFRVRKTWLKSLPMGTMFTPFLRRRYTTTKSPRKIPLKGSWVRPAFLDWDTALAH